MKIEDHPEAGPVRPASDPGRFQQELKKAAPRPGGGPLRAGSRPPGAPGSARSTASSVAALTRVAPGGPLASAEHLGQVRQVLHAEAHRLLATRGEAQRTQREQVHQRVGELIARELARETPPGARPASPPPGAPPRERSDPQDSRSPAPAPVSAVPGDTRSHTGPASAGTCSAALMRSEIDASSPSRAMAARIMYSKSPIITATM